ncbi:MAG: hypothetical protein J6033_04020 [Lachnospiraceae bacterium]|nr:hypothetical protein [Lachnospiraceae bacterium]
MKKIKNTLMKKRIGAYLSLEASYVIPIVLAVIIFLLYVMIYKYDDCVINSKALLRAMSENPVNVTTVFMEESDEVKTENPLYIEVKESGKFIFPFSDMEVLKETEKEWKVEARGRYFLTDPAFTIRSAKKIKKLMEEDDGN